MALIKCSECGHMISDKAVSCPQCGAPVEKKIQCTECGEFVFDNSVDCPNCGCPLEKKMESKTNSYRATKSVKSYIASKNKKLDKIIEICVFQKFAQFSGRATREEFWYFFFCYMFFLIGAVCSFSTSKDGIHPIMIKSLITIFNVGLFIPSISVSIRRLHDVNKSGWNMLWLFLPVIGIIILIIYWLQKSDKDNQYGHSLT